MDAAGNLPGFMSSPVPPQTGEMLIQPGTGASCEGLTSWGTGPAPMPPGQILGQGPHASTHSFTGEYSHPNDPSGLPLPS